MIHPMLAYKCPRTMTMDQFLAQIVFPVLATPKIDGIRCITAGDVVTPPGHMCFPHTRSLKPIPNNHVREQIAKLCPAWLDGELVCGTSFQAVTSGIMSHGGRPDFTYYVFDCEIEKGDVIPYVARVKMLQTLYETKLPPFVKILTPCLCESLDDLLKYETMCLNEGAEGVMIRPLDSPYDQRRSNKSRPYLVAIKRFEDAEARVIGFKERMHNGNAPEKNALGYQERSTHQAAMVPMNTLGSFVCKDLSSGEEFSVGTGFDRGFADMVWAHREDYLSKILKYRHQAHGAKDAPRIPTFIGFRDPADMSPTKVQKSQDELDLGTI